VITSGIASVAVVESGDRTVGAAAGKNISLAIQTAGDGLTYAWHRTDGQPVTQARYSGAATAKLTIAAFNPDLDRAAYYCTVTRSGVAEPVSSGLITLVQDVAKPVVPAQTLPPGTVATRYASPLSGGLPSTRFTASGLPPGLACDAFSGLISGLPTKAGSYRVKVTATNAVGAGSVTLPLVIAALPRSLVGTFTGADYGLGLVPVTVTITEAGSYSGDIPVGLFKNKMETHRFTGQLVSQPDGTFAGPSTRFTWGHDEGNRGTGQITVKWALNGALAAEWAYYNESDEYLGATTIPLHKNLWHTRTNPATAYAGYHTTELFQTDTSADPTTLGSGFASFTVGLGGTLTVAGRLPDGTAFTIPTFLTQAGTTWVHRWLYKDAGSLYGQFALSTGTPPAFTDSAVTGQFQWNSPPAPNASFWDLNNGYLNGVSIALGMRGSRYLKPNTPNVTGPLMMNAGALLPANVTFTATGGSMAQEITVAGLLGTKHTASFPGIASDPVNVTKLTFNSATGAFSGTALIDCFDPGYVFTASAAFLGLVVRSNAALPGGYAAGYFSHAVAYDIYDDSLGYPVFVIRIPGKLSGRVLIQPRPAP
jgi:hypothetical protein